MTKISFLVILETWILILYKLSFLRYDKCKSLKIINKRVLMQAVYWAFLRS